MPDFQWQTLEDEDPWQPPAPPPRPRRPKRSIWLIALAIGLVASVVGLLYWQIQRRADLVTQAIEDDVLASHTLYQQAVADQDTDLFNILISGEDDMWTMMQQRMLATGELNGYSPFELDAVDTSAEASVTLSPDLSSAELVQPRVLRLGREEPFTLNQTLIFKPGRVRWLVAAPEAEFWGDWQETQIGSLTATYPARDAELMARMLPDLHAEVMRACTELADIACPNDLRLIVRFDKAPESLVMADDPTLPLIASASLPLTLPAPSLIGTPTDDRGYDALVRGYAGPIVAAAIAASSEWECCEQGLFFRALLDRQLADLGLRDLPMDSAEIRRLFDEEIPDITALETYWRDSPQPPNTLAAIQVAALIDYLLMHQPAVSPAAMQQELASARLYYTWLQNYTQQDDDSLQRNWLRHVADMVNDNDAIAAPDQALALTCAGGTTFPFPFRAYRYEPLTQWLTPLPSVGGEAVTTTFLTALPDDSGLFIQEQDLKTNTLNNWIVKDGLSIDVNGPPTANRLVIGANVSEGKLQLLEIDNSPSRRVWEFVDLDSCGPDGCETRLNPSPFMWAPDGSRTLTQNALPWIGGPTGNPASTLGDGYAPYWWDSQRAGYMRTRFDGNDTLVMVPLSTNTTYAVTELVTQEELQQALPADLKPEMLVEMVMRAPNHNVLFLLATSYIEEIDAVASRLFRYDVDSDEVEFVYAVAQPPSAVTPLTFSATGDWLTLKTNDPRSTAATLTLVAVDGSQPPRSFHSEMTLTSHDWSLADDWLLRAEGAFFELLNPTTGESRIDVHGFNRCDSAVWVN